jgi:transcriptional regulator with XRE-family HTH domain
MPWASPSPILNRGILRKIRPDTPEYTRELVRKFGAELRDARLSAGIDQKTLAARGNAPQGGVSQIETGKLIPDCEIAARLVEAATLQLTPFLATHEQAAMLASLDDPLAAIEAAVSLEEKRRRPKATDRNARCIRITVRRLLCGSV